MATDRTRQGDDGMLDPEDVNSAPGPAEAPITDPNDLIPVPPAMSPAELDERGTVVEELREEARSTGPETPEHRERRERGERRRETDRPGPRADANSDEQS